MLWLAIHFPCLALEVHARGSESSQPLAIAEDASSRGSILICNAAAHAADLRPGMIATSALALCADLRIIPRAPESERHALERVAAWACQFTSQISIAGTTELLLEIGGSLALFGSINTIVKKVSLGLLELGYVCRLACAETPLAAQWFVRADRKSPAVQLQIPLSALDDLPVTVLRRPEMVEMLEKFGISTIGECRCLPREGLAHRLGQEIFNELDRARGALPDPRPLFTPPSIFRSQLALPAPTAHAEALLFAARRLCTELCGYLVATGQGIQRLGLTLFHEHRQRTHVRLELITATRDLDHLLTLLRERLTILKLPQPALAMRLVCMRSQPLAAVSQPLLPDRRTRVETATRLLEKLQTRLGSDAICSLRPVDDHRPEQSWQTCAPQDNSTPLALPPCGKRPLWLLQDPQPLSERNAVPHCNGPLSLLIGPERIESGWWDDRPVARDYFVARDPEQSLLWIYRERNADGRWFLQGYFS